MLAQPDINVPDDNVLTDFAITAVADCLRKPPHEVQEAQFFLGADAITYISTVFEQKLGKKIFGFTGHLLWWYINGSHTIPEIVSGARAYIDELLRE